jgi:hypothetical protein
MIPKLKYGLLFLIILNSCQPNRVLESADKTVLLSELGAFPDIQFADLVDSIQYVQLESSKNSLIADIRHIRITNHGIYIYDRNQGNVLKFSQDGKFQFKFNKGKGVGELLQPKWFSVTPQGDIFILEKGGRVKWFNKDGTYKSEIQLNFTPRSFEYVPKYQQLVFYNSFITNRNIEEGNSSYNCIITDLNGKIIAKLAPVPKCIKVQSYIGLTNVFSVLNDEVYVHIQFKDQIYKVGKIDLIPEFGVDFLNNNQDKATAYFEIMAPNTLDDSEYIEKKRNETRFHRLLIYNQLESSMFFCSSFGNEPNFWFYDKSSKKSYKLCLDEIDYISTPFYSVSTSSDGFYVSTIESYKLMKAYEKEAVENSDLIKLIKGLDVSSNPIVIKMKLKNF